MRISTDGKIMVQCDLCGKEYQHGPHRYEGHKWHQFDMMVCEICHSTSHDGIPPIYEGVFKKILEQKGIAIPSRNKKGFYSRGITN